MGQFLKIINKLTELNNRLANHEAQYTHEYKGTIYYTRRDIYIKSIKQYIFKAKEIAQGPMIYEMVGKLDGRLFRITIVDMSKEETQLFIQLITNKEVEILKVKEKETGNLEFLE